MPAYQVYLNDEQKNYLLKYMSERHSGSIRIMGVTAFFAILCCLLLISYNMTFIETLATEGGGTGFIFFVICVAVFAKVFITGFGKTFGYKCDIQCIKKDLYTLDYGDFGYREKDTGNSPYYICDNRGDVYICPRFSDYCDADSGSHFLYIKLDNGRNYAILDE